MIVIAFSCACVFIYSRSALRNWDFQVSKDGVNWTTVYSHVNDDSLNEPGSVTTADMYMCNMIL